MRSVRVVVANKELPWYLRWFMTRESALDCRAEVQFKYLDGRGVYSGTMPGRWASTPQPVPLMGMLGDPGSGQTLVPLQIWDQNLMLSAQTIVDIPPGESEALDIANRCDNDYPA
jgi:hypothetical protein